MYHFTLSFHVNEFILNQQSRSDIQVLNQKYQRQVIFCDKPNQARGWPSRAPGSFIMGPPIWTGNVTYFVSSKKFFKKRDETLCQLGPHLQPRSQKNIPGSNGPYLLPQAMSSATWINTRDHVSPGRTQTRARLDGQTFQIKYPENLPQRTSIVNDMYRSGF